jgi:hypothetical protein
MHRWAAARVTLIAGSERISACPSTPYGPLDRKASGEARLGGFKRSAQFLGEPMTV